MQVSCTGISNYTPKLRVFFTAKTCVPGNNSNCISPKMCHKERVLLWYSYGIRFKNISQRESYLNIFDNLVIFKAFTCHQCILTVRVLHDVRNECWKFEKWILKMQSYHPVEFCNVCFIRSCTSCISVAVGIFGTLPITIVFVNTMRIHVLLMHTYV